MLRLSQCIHNMKIFYIYITYIYFLLILFINWLLICEKYVKCHKRTRYRAERINTYPYVKVLIFSLYIGWQKKNVYEPCWYSGTPLLPDITFSSRQMRHDVYLVTLNPALCIMVRGWLCMWAQDFIYEGNRLRAGFSSLISI